jgi:hypothetical protein
LIFFRNAHHQLPEAPPPPDEPPPPEKPPPPDNPPLLLDLPELMRIFNTTFRKNLRNPGETTSKVMRAINAAMRTQLIGSAVC